MINRMKMFSGLILATSLSTSAEAGDSIAGQEVYAVHCASCHGPEGVPALPDVPDFTIGQGLQKSDLVLIQTIRSGQKMMPAYEFILTEKQLLDVLAYLRTF